MSKKNPSPNPPSAAAGFPMVDHTGKPLEPVKFDAPVPVAEIEKWLNGRAIAGWRAEHHDGYDRVCITTWPDYQHRSFVARLEMPAPSEPMVEANQEPQP